MPDEAPELPPPPRILDLEGLSLFLDLDGTLAAIQPRPEDVGPEPWRTALLRRLGRRLGGRLAVVSGRTLEEVDRILEGSVGAVAAVHGRVLRWPGGAVERPEAPAALADARRRVQALAQSDPGVLIEDKGLSLAIHYRLAPALGEAIRSMADDTCRAEGLKLQLGDMVAEIASPGPDKGAAVRAFMAEPPFAGSRPAFVGDDLTDEDGFAAVAALGGVGVLVGPPRVTHASGRLADAGAVRAWLEAAVMEGAGT
jgi:trehalose 6-phosphate phosphatase